MSKVNVQFEMEDFMKLLKDATKGLEELKQRAMLEAMDREIKWKKEKEKTDRSEIRVPDPERPCIYTVLTETPETKLGNIDYDDEKLDIKRETIDYSKLNALLDRVNGDFKITPDDIIDQCGTTTCDECPFGIRIKECHPNFFNPKYSCGLKYKGKYIYRYTNGHREDDDE